MIILNKMKVEAILTNTLNVQFIKKKKCSKVSVTDALNGSYQVSLHQQIRFYSKIFGKKHCRYNEGPLYMRFFSDVPRNKIKNTLKNPVGTLHIIKHIYVGT